MNLVRTLLCLAAIAGAGCAAPQRSALIAEDYKFIGYNMNVVERCGASGQMDPALASQGRSFLRSFVQRHIHDPARLDASIRRFQNMEPSDSECNKVAMEIHDMNRNVRNHNASVAQSQQEVRDAINSMPRRTHCNQIGTQVMCTSY